MCSRNSVIVKFIQVFLTKNNTQAALLALPSFALFELCWLQMGLPSLSLSISNHSNITTVIHTPQTHLRTDGFIQH